MLLRIKVRQFVPIRKLYSACWHARNFCSQFRTKISKERRARVFRRWLGSLNKSMPEVLVGANFVNMGGTRQHMHALKKYSSMRVELAPGELVMKTMGPWHVMSEHGCYFDQFHPSYLKAVHSNVFPWYIHWCKHQKEHCGTRWIHTHHNWYYPEFGKGALETWQEDFNEGFLFALRNADVCLSVSRWQQKFLKQTFGLDTHYLPNGVDVRACDQANANRWIAKNGLRDFVLYLGRNDPVKNPVDFVLLAQEQPNIQFVMLGQGLSPDVLRDEWQVSVPKNLAVLGGVSHSEAQDAIAACSVLVMTSKREGLPTLALEAMAQCKPVVVPTEDGCMEVVGGGEFGFVYEQGNIVHLAEMTLQALRDKRRCVAARQHVLQQYDWPVVMQKLDRIYEGASVP